MTIATIDGNACSRARVHLPSWGVWYADLDVVGAVALSGAVTIAIGAATYAGTIVVGGVYEGRSAYRVAGGAHGWRTAIAGHSYVNDLGVKRASIVTDAAAACGEDIDTAGLVGAIGPAYVRAADLASRVLDDAAPRAWYVGVEGTTRFGARTATTITTDAPRVRVDPAAGMITIAPDPADVAALVPGVSLDGATAVDVQIDVDAESGLRATLYSSPWGASRRSNAWRAIVRAIVPEARWNGAHEYRVVALESDSGRLALQAVRTVRGMPDLRFVRVRPGIAGASCDPMLGSLVLVTFVDSDPARPVVVAFDDEDAPGFVPTAAALDATASVTIGASATLTTIGSGTDTPVDATGRIVRYGDNITWVTPGPGLIVPAVSGVTPIAKVSA